MVNYNFEWDPIKAKSNLDRYGVEFEEAANIRDEITRLKDIIVGKPSAM